jgi:5-formyltetrahydrofolate cyclo-ligase
MSPAAGEITHNRRSAVDKRGVKGTEGGRIATLSAQISTHPPVASRSMLTKADWRRRAIQARSGIVADGLCHCDGLVEFLQSEAVPSGWVVGYRAMTSEIDLSTLFDRPRIGPFALTRTPEHGVNLTVHPLDSPSERHRYGFDQPVAGAPLVADRDIAVVLVPGLAFDRLGGRLGRGKGYYDRFLARLSSATIMVGVTGGYIVAELPTDAHDIAMTHLSGDFGVAPVPLDEPVEEF